MHPLAHCGIPSTWFDAWNLIVTQQCYMDERIKQMSKSMNFILGLSQSCPLSPGVNNISDQRLGEGEYNREREQEG